MPDEDEERADSMLAEVYARAAATDRYRCTFHPGPHRFGPDMQSEAFEWSDGWLRPGSVRA